VIGVSRGVHTIGEIREKVFLRCSKGNGDSVVGLVGFAPGMVLLDRVKQGDQFYFISGLNKFLISYKAMQKSSLAPKPSISYALHNFGHPDREFQALPYCSISSSKFNTVSSYRIRMVTRQKREVYTNVGGIKIRRSGVPRAYQEESGSTGPAPET